MRRKECGCEEGAPEVGRNDGDRKGGDGRATVHICYQWRADLSLLGLTIQLSSREIKTNPRLC